MILNVDKSGVIDWIVSLFKAIVDINISIVNYDPLAIPENPVSRRTLINKY